MREQDLLKHIYGYNRSLPQRVIVPPGDDMGAVQISGKAVLVAVDQVADGVHVDLKSTPIEKVGRKAMTRCLSDVAAMAAKPTGALVAASLPHNLGGEKATKLFDVMRRVGESYGCPLIGGDLLMWDQPLVLSVTVLAEPDGIDPVLRRGAQVGDAIYVTGQLGGSGQAVGGYVHHLDFEPRIELARWLAGDLKSRPRCMIDLSDGLAMDLGRVCQASGVGALLWVDRLPISVGARMAQDQDGIDAWRHALGDGEDYELCFTWSDSGGGGEVPQEVEGVLVTQVGVITDAPKGDQSALIRVQLPDGSFEQAQGLGWEHRG